MNPSHEKDFKNFTIRALIHENVESLRRTAELEAQCNEAAPLIAELTAALNEAQSILEAVCAERNCIGPHPTRTCLWLKENVDRPTPLCAKCRAEEWLSCETTSTPPKA